MKKYKNPKQLKTQAKEPKGEYLSADKPISFKSFGSFEEMNDADLREMASFTPLQRMKHVTELLKQLYSEELKKTFSDLVIHFR